MCHFILTPRTSSASGQLLTLPEPDPEMGRGAVGRRGKRAGWTELQQSRAWTTAVTPPPDAHLTGRAASARTPALWKGATFPAGGRESVWLPCPDLQAPLACFCWVLGAQLLYPRADCSSNEPSFTGVSSYLAGVWAVTGTGIMLVRQAAGGWVKGRALGVRRSKGCERSSCPLPV